MSLTKTDLSAIKEIVNSSIDSRTPSVVQRIVQSETRKIIKEELIPVRKDIKRVENKLDDHFNFLDKDVSYFRKKVASHLDVKVSELSTK